MLKFYRTLKYFMLWRLTGECAYLWEYLHYYNMEKFAKLGVLSWPTHHDRFTWFWRFGLAINYGIGRKEFIETCPSIHFPAAGGKWVNIIWRFYFQTNKKGYRHK